MSSKKNSKVSLSDLKDVVIIEQPIVNNEQIFEPEKHIDVKGVELPDHEKVQVISHLQKLINLVEYELSEEHQNVVLKWRNVGESFLKLKEYIENNKISLGFTSFKGWYGDQKLGTRQIGYSQATKYMTIATNFEAAKKVYEDSKNWSLSSVSSEVNVLVGKAKTKVEDDVKPSTKTKAKPQSAGDVSNTLTSEAPKVTSLQAVLDFIAASDESTLNLLQDAIDHEMFEKFGKLQLVVS